MGLDDPLWQQYLNYLNNLLHGDLGSSIVNSQPVLKELLIALPGDHRADGGGDDLRGRRSASRSAATPHATPRAGRTAR